MTASDLRQRLRMTACARALALLLALLALPAIASADGTVAVKIGGLGPLLLPGKRAGPALQRYAHGLLAHNVFPRSTARIAQLPRVARPARLDRRRPVIGVQLNEANDLVTAAGRKSRRAFADAIREAGGEPVFLPPAASTRQIKRLLGNIDHLVLAGGADVDPFYYRKPVTHAVKLNRQRDRYELRLVREAVKAGIGIDAVCRGMQLLNVAMGGTLHQDLAKDGVTTRSHRGRGASHTISLARACGLARSTGRESLRVNSWHHEGVSELGHGLRVVARSADGVIEAIESRNGALRGYQFHPELMRGRVKRVLFADMVGRAKRRRSAR